MITFFKSNKDLDSTLFLVFVFIVFIGTNAGAMFLEKFADTEACKFTLKVCEVVIIGMGGYFFRKSQETNGNGGQKTA